MRYSCFMAKEITTAEYQALAELRYRIRKFVREGDAVARSAGLEQILLRLKAGRARHGVPFPDELANAVAQFCQRLVFRSGDFFRHETTISHCDIYFHSTARADSGKLLVEKLP